MSALLVAVTVSVVGDDGATYAPEELIEPFAAAQVTDVSLTVPLTEAENVSLPPV